MAPTQLVVLYHSSFSFSSSSSSTFSSSSEGDEEAGKFHQSLLVKGVLPEVGVDGADEQTEDRRESTSMRTTWSWAPMMRPVIGLK